jgi:hypothetical protein
MLGFGTTAGKIDDFETRFTVVNGAHFLIAGNGAEAWPISAAEATEFKALYRGRMIRARWLRRLTVLGPILLILLGNMSWGWPKPVLAAMGTAAALLILAALTFGIQYHPLISYVTKVEIERRLKRRIATNMPAALTPSMTPLGRFARRLLFVCVALEIGLGLLHLLVGPTIFAEFLSLNDGSGYAHLAWLIWLTPGLSSLIHAGLLVAILLLVLDRWSRRQAAKQANPSGPPATGTSGRRPT